MILGNTKDAISEIEAISDSKVNILDATGVLIATFSTAVEITELNDYFKLLKRSFFLFDLNPENSGYHITKESIHEGLFGFLSKVNTSVREQDLLDMIKSTTKASKTKKEVKVKVKELTEEEIMNMKPIQKKTLFNELLDKGYENLTDNDKKILPLLAK
jgi:hypothetical protein